LLLSCSLIGFHPSFIRGSSGGLSAESEPWHFLYFFPLPQGQGFIDSNQPPFVIETTDIGKLERTKRTKGEKPKKNAGELAIFDFMSSEDGFRRYLALGEPVALLFEDTDWHIFCTSSQPSECSVEWSELVQSNPPTTSFTK
jgi:hypothetical protein